MDTEILRGCAADSPVHFLDLDLDCSGAKSTRKGLCGNQNPTLAKHGKARRAAAASRDKVPRRSPAGSSDLTANLNLVFFCFLSLLRSIAAVAASNGPHTGNFTPRDRMLSARAPTMPLVEITAEDLQRGVPETTC